MGRCSFYTRKDDAIVQLDPWELPSVFLLRHKSMSKSKKQKSLRTPSGYWKEKAEEFTAIRSAGGRPSFAMPSYVGVRKTLEFYLNDGTRGGEGTKTHWIIHEYHNLRKDDGKALFLEEDVVLRKVFKKGETYQASSLWLQVWFRDMNLGCDYKDAYFEFKRQKELTILSNEISELTPQKVPSEGLNEDLGAHCHPDGKSDDDVWKHFTKICTNNPDVVYAACHHCDKVLKAHPKKHGTTQLKRHRSSAKCRSNCCNPSTDEDCQLLHLLRTVLDPYKQQKIDGKLECQEVNAHLTQLNPCVLSHHVPWYVTTSLNRQTNEGCWEEIHKEFTAIRMEQQQMQGSWRDIDKDISAIQMDHQLQMQVPQYMGLRRTLEFRLNQNGNKVKTGWIMLEYQQVDDIKSPALFLQGDMVIRKVFRYDKHEVDSAFSDFNRWLNGDDDSEEYSYKGEGVNTGTTTLSTDYEHGGGDRKRKRSAGSKRTSEVWMYFTEIRTEDHDVVYAVCHHCDRGYGSARSTNGISHLKRHKESCERKLPGTGNVNNGAKAAWEAEIWPLFLLFKNYAETEQQGCAEARSQEDGPAC